MLIYINSKVFMSSEAHLQLNSKNFKPYSCDLASVAKDPISNLGFEPSFCGGYLTAVPTLSVR